jgi:hypothetical protein
MPAALEALDYRSDRIAETARPLEAMIVRLDGTPYHVQNSRAETSKYASETLAIPTPSSASEGRNMPVSMRQSLMVPVPTVIQRVSAAVFLFCCFSLVLYFAGGFTALHPFVSIFLAVASVIFYVMGGIIGRSASHMA